MSHLCPIYVRALQEYLEALADTDDVLPRRLRRLLMAFAEFRFKLRGGSKCAVCRMSVRHVLPVKVERKNGTRVDYPCLCTRCIEGEKAVSRRLVLEVGKARVEYASREVDYEVLSSPPPEPAEKKLKAKAG
jgi:hypothetical protein